MRRSVLVKVPSFSRRGSAREDYIRVSAGLGEENVLHDEEVELLKRSGDDVGVRVSRLMSSPARYIARRVPS